MLRKSNVIAIALGLTALASTALPSAAKPSATPGSVHFGGTSIHAPAGAGLQPQSNKVSLTQLPPGVGSHLDKLKVIEPHTGSITGISPDPLKVPVPGGNGNGNGKGIDNICPFNKFKCPSKPAPQPPAPPSGNTTQPPGGGPIVILAPRAPIEVPVPMPIQTGTVAAQISTGVGPAVAQARPAISGQGCGSSIPVLGAAIDELLPTAQLAADDMTRVTVMRALIQQLAASGKDASARDVEEVAMNLLGYQKLWLRCGYGTFNWIKQAANLVAQ